MKYSICRFYIGIYRVWWFFALSKFNTEEQKKDEKKEKIHKKKEKKSRKR